MKRSILMFAVAAFAVGISGSAYAEQVSGRTITLHPTGQFPDDVEAVQTAVDGFSAEGRNGTLILKARNEAGQPTSFNFGTHSDPSQRGSVVVLASAGSGAVTFAGEAWGGARTTIRGGNIVFSFERRDRLVVRDIVFERPYQHAVFVRQSTGANIEDNTIVDLEGVTDTVNFLPFPRAISFRGVSLGEDEDITGNILVRGNVIERSNAAFADAIHFASTDARIRVVDNLVEGLNVGVRSNVQSQPILVARNYFSTRRSNSFFTAGVSVGCNSSRQGSVRIRDNYIDADANGIAVSGYDAASLGFEINIECSMSDVVIDGNDVSANIFSPIEVSGYAEVFTQVSDVRVSNNVIRGTAPIGIDLADYSALFGFPGRSELFDARVVDNTLSLFAGPIDVSFDAATRDSFMRVTPEDTVEDRGTNNRIVRRFH